MCLVINKSVELPQTKKAYFIGYKVLNPNFSAPLHSSYKYKQKWNYPRSECTIENIHSNVINVGVLHIFLTKKVAESFAGCDNDIVIPVRCYYKDVKYIGHMDGSMCYPCVGMSRVYIENKIYKENYDGTK